MGALYLTNATGDTWVELSVPTPSIALNDLSDVDVAGVVTGQALVYNGGAGEWQPQNVAQFIDDLLDVDTTGVTDGQILIYDNLGSEWVVGDKVSTISDLSDVATITQAKGDIIVSSGALFDALNVGTDGQVPIADSGASLGISWGVSFQANLILTADLEVLVDEDGNVITESV